MLALAEFEYAEWDAGDEERRYEAEGRAAVSNFDFVDSVHDRFIECRFKQSTLGFTADTLADTVVIGTLQRITDVDEGWIDNAGLDTCIRFAAYIQVFWLSA